MNFKQYILTMSFSAIISWIAWVVVILNINPYETSLVGLLLFYVTLTMALASSLAIVIFVLKKLTTKKELIVARIVQGSFRQALLLTFLVIGILILQNLGYLKIWIIIVFILFITSLEFFFISSREA